MASSFSQTDHVSHSQTPVDVVFHAIASICAAASAMRPPPLRHEPDEDILDNDAFLERFGDNSKADCSGCDNVDADVHNQHTVPAGDPADNTALNYGMIKELGKDGDDGDGLPQKDVSSEPNLEYRRL